MDSGLSDVCSSVDIATAWSSSITGSVVAREENAYVGLPCSLQIITGQQCSQVGRAASLTPLRQAPFSGLGSFREARSIRSFYGEGGREGLTFCSYLTDQISPDSVQLKTVVLVFVFYLREQSSKTRSALFLSLPLCFNLDMSSFVFPQAPRSLPKSEPWLLFIFNF